MMDLEDGWPAQEVSDDECDYDLDITKDQADLNYKMAGSEVDEPTDQICVSRYQQLMLNDNVHQKIMAVLEETHINFELADFQLISLHVLGSQRNLVLVSPTGSGKMLGKIQ